MNNLNKTTACSLDRRISVQSYDFLKSMDIEKLRSRLKIHGRESGLDGRIHPVIKTLKIYLEDALMKRPTLS